MTVEDMKGLVSIIMPLYNNEMFVVESIESIQKQTYPNWELLVIDDCSTDHSIDKILELAKSDNRIKLLRNTVNSGAALSRNFGLREAKGRWVAFLDSDDLWLPTKLASQINFMMSHGYDFSYTNYQEIDEQGQATGFYWTGPKVVTNLKLHTYNYLGCLTVMYDREKIGLIQVTDLKKRNDYALWLKVSKKSPAYLFDSVEASYRVRESGSLTNRQKGAHALVKWHYKLFRQSEEKSFLVSTFWTGVNIVAAVFKKKVYRKSRSVLEGIKGE